MNEKTAIIFCIGRELLEGFVLDRNAHFMASHITKCGLRVRSAQALDDIEEEVVAAFRHALSLAPDFIMVTGGMGPGMNDISRESAAKAADLPLVVDETARQFLANSYRRLVAKGIVEDAKLTDERLKMATIPHGATCYENLSGTAPALSFAVGKTTFFLLPGQPEELRRLFTQYVQPRLEKEGPGGYRETAHIDYPGGDESLISRMLTDLGRRHPKVHSRSRLQGNEDDTTIRITLSADGTDRAILREQVESAEADIRARLGLEVSRSLSQDEVAGFDESVPE